MHTKVRVDEVVIVGDAMKEGMTEDESEDVDVDVEVVVDEVVVKDVEDEQVGLCDANVNEEAVVADDVLQDVEDEVQDVDVEDDLDEVEDDAVYDVPADGKVLFCDVAVEEVVVEPPLGDAVANIDVRGKMPDRSKVLDVQDVNVDL